MLKRLFIFLLVIGIGVGIGRHALQSGSGAIASSTSQASTYDIAVPHDAPIPKEALRLRVIANSDRPEDQTLKLQVRDAVVVYTAKLLKGAKNSDEARQLVTRAVPQLQQLAQEVVRQHGYHYAVHTEVGKVPFPTKIYGNQVYPAGEYEALRIIIGQGAGQNWWCVLFPPLCFVDISNGDAVPNTGGFPDLPPLETIQVPAADGQPTKVAVRLASADYGEALWKEVQHMFS